MGGTSIEVDLKRLADVKNGLVGNLDLAPKAYVEPRDWTLLACLNTVVEACLLTEGAAKTFLATLDFTRYLAVAVRVALESIV